MILLLALFAFAPATWSSWETICASRPYQSGDRIQPAQMEAMTVLHELNVPGFWTGEPMPSPIDIEGMCESFEKFKKFQALP